MHRAQEQVRDFHRAMGIPAPSHLQTLLKAQRVSLRRELIREEAQELDEAFRAAESYAGADCYITAEQIDALCDLLYVVYGTAVEMGVDLAPFFELVHEANMKKGPGPMREDGKKLKPEGWEPPALGAEFTRQLQRR